MIDHPCKDGHTLQVVSETEVACTRCEFKAWIVPIPDEALLMPYEEDWRHPSLEEMQSIIND